MAAAAVELDKQRCVHTFIAILYKELGGPDDDGIDMPLMRSAVPELSTQVGDSVTLMDEYISLQASEDGKFTFQENLSTGLATALLGELVLRGLVVIVTRKKDKLDPYSDYGIEFTAAAGIPTGVPILDEAIALMRTKPDESAVWWARVLTNYQLHKGVKHLASRSCEHAVQQGLLEKEEHSKLHIFHNTKYLTPHNGAGVALRSELKDSIREFALHGVRPQSTRRLVFAALIYSLMISRNISKCVKSRNLFASKDEKKLALHNLDNVFLYKKD